MGFVVPLMHLRDTMYTNNFQTHCNITHPFQITSHVTSDPPQHTHTILYLLASSFAVTWTMWGFRYWETKLHGVQRHVAGRFRTLRRVVSSSPSATTRPTRLSFQKSGTTRPTTRRHKPKIRMAKQDNEVSDYVIVCILLLVTNSCNMPPLGVRPASQSLVTTRSVQRYGAQRCIVRTQRGREPSPSQEAGSSSLLARRHYRLYACSASSHT